MMILHNFVIREKGLTRQANAALSQKVLSRWGDGVINIRKRIALKILYPGALVDQCHLTALCGVKYYTWKLMERDANRE